MQDALHEKMQVQDELDTRLFCKQIPNQAVLEGQSNQRGGGHRNRGCCVYTASRPSLSFV